MTRFFLRRFGQVILTLFGVSVIVFILVRLTGDPAAILLPPETPPAAVAAFRAANGLDQPWPVQYWTFLVHLFEGDLGNSIRYQQSVVSLIGERLSATGELAGGAILLSVVVALPLGILGALRRGSWVDSIGRVVGLFGQAVPTFYMGIILILIFSVSLRLLPAGGRGDFSNLILPWLSLGAFLVPLILRVTRGSVLEVLNQDYVRAARAKGMRERRVIVVHVLKASLIPVVTVLGLQVGIALSGAIVTETVFSWPGIGQLLVNAISSRDFPLVQGVVLFASAAFILINLVIDLVYRLLDPRIGLQ